MPTAACLPMAADRAGPCVRTIRIVGIDLTGVTLEAQLRLSPDTPGAPLVDLTMTADAAVQGLRLVGVDLTGPVPISTIGWRINDATMKDATKVPYMGEVGDPAVLAYDLIATIGGDKRRLIYGTFTALATVNGADNAPATRPPSSGGTTSGGSAWTVATVTFSNDAVSITIDGADILAPLVAAAKSYRDQAVAAAGGAAGDAAGAIAADRAASSASAALSRDWASKAPGVDVDPAAPGLKSSRSYAQDALTAANRITSRRRIRPGPTRWSVLDSANNPILTVSRTLIDHPYIRAIVARLPSVQSAVRKVRPGPTRWSVLDSAGNRLMAVSRTLVDHPDINAIRANAAAGAGAAAPRRRVRIVSRHGGWNIPNVQRSNGVATSGTDRLPFVVFTASAALRLLLVNGYADPTGQINPTGNALRVAAAFDQPPLVPAIVLPNATGTAMSAGGKTASIIADGGFVWSEPVQLGAFLPGNTYYYRVHKLVAAGERWPLNAQSGTDQWIGGGSTTDPVYGTTVTTGADGTATNAAALGAYTATAWAFGASMIVGEQLVAVAVVGIGGDSIGAGASGVPGLGHIGQAIRANGNNAFCNVAIAGSTLANQVKFAQIPQIAARYVDHFVVHGGTNDLYNGGWVDLAAAQAGILAYARAVSTVENKVWFSTIYPRLDPKLASLTSAGTTATATLDRGWLPAIGTTFQTTIGGAGQGGYNGTVTATVVSATTFSYPVASGLVTPATGAIVYTAVDAGKDYAGQVPSAAYEALRVAFNNWVRDPGANGMVAYLTTALGAGRVGGFIDAATAIERNADGSAVVLDANGQQAAGSGGRFISNGVAGTYTADLIHPKQAAIDLCAARVPAAALAIIPTN